VAQRRIEVVITGDERGFSNALQKSSKQSKAFAAEVTGLKTHLAGLATGLLASGGVVFGFEKLVNAGEGLEKSTNQLNAQLRVTGVTAGQAAPYIAQLQNRMEKFGFTNVETNTGLTYLTRATGNTRSALGLMGDAANLARGRHIALSQAALVLGKVWDGNTTALRRLGIILPKHATTMQALAAIHQRFSGQAAAGTTTMDKFRASVTDLEAKLGKTLLPTINKLIAPLQVWLSNTRNQERVQRAFKSALQTLAVVIQEVVKYGGQVVRVLSNFAGMLGGGNSLTSKVKALAEAWIVYKGAVIAAGIATSESLKKMKAAMVSTGIGLAFLALGLAATYVMNHWEKTKHFFSALWTTLKMGFKNMWDEIQILGLEAYKHILEPFSHLPFGMGKWAQKAKDNVENELGQLKADMAKNGAEAGDAWGKNYEQRVVGWVKTAAGMVKVTMPVGAASGMTPAAIRAAASGKVPSGHGAQGIVNTATYASSQRNANTVGFHLPGEAQPYDCSAFVQAVYARNGISIGRTTYAQVKQGNHISRSDLAPGDLIFMNFPGERSPGHVGIYIGGGQMVHDRGAHGGVQQTGVPWSNVVDTRTYTRKGGKNETAVRSDLPAAEPPPPQSSTTKPKSHKKAAVASFSLTDILPTSFQVAMTKAARTTGVGDDITAYGKALTYLQNELEKTKNKLKRLKIEDEITKITNALKKFKQQAVEQGKAAGDKAIAGFLGIAGQVGGSFGISGQGVELGMLNQKFADLQTQLAKTKNAFERAKIKEEMAKVKEAADELRDSLRSTIMSNQLQAGIDKALQAFDQETNAHLKSMQKNLQRTIDSLDKQLQAGLAQIESNRAALTPSEALLKQMQDAHASEQSQEELQSAQDALQQAMLGGDPKEIADAQKALNEVLYNQKIEALQKQADIERAASDDSARLQSEALQTRFDQLKADASEREALAEDSYNSQREIERVTYNQMLEDQAALELSAELQDANQKGAWDRLLDGLAKDWNRYRTWLAKNQKIEVVAPNDNPSFGDDPFPIGVGNFRIKPLAKGGVVKATPGGRLIVAGEAGYDEAIVPLNGPNARGMGTTINLNIGTVIGTGLDEAAKELADPIRREILRTQRRNGTSAWS
jgi:cell wall-associated NlpC family hydrolase